jgi:hypothetical protein
LKNVNQSQNRLHDYEHTSFIGYFLKEKLGFFLKIGNKGNRQNKLVKTSKNGKIWGGKKNDKH